MMSGIPDAPPAPSSNPARVLVVEDEAMVGEVVCAMLQMGGFESVHAKGGAEALEILKEPERHFDLVLTDFRMPGVTGIELIQQVRALRPGMKTVLYSGNADESVVKGYRAQPDRFLRKPFTPKVLNDLVRAVLAE